MTNHMGWKLASAMGFVLCVTLMTGIPAVADDENIVRAALMDPGKLAGIDVPAEEAFIDAEDVLDGNHRPRGEILYYGKELIAEVYEDGPVTIRYDDPFLYDEFVTILSGKLILTASDGESQEFVAGDSFVIPKGFTGLWQVLGNFRELVVIETKAYEAAYGAPSDE